MATTIAKGGANKLIALLPRAEQKRLAAELEVVPLAPRTVLFEPNAPLEHVYFLHSGMVCLMATLELGAVETAAIGVEGFIGFVVVLGGGLTANRAIVQLPGTASRIAVRRFKQLLKQHPKIDALLLRYVRFFLVQSLQSVACNSLHGVDERCAKLLLLALDRANSTGTLDLTQEFLAEMLGVHRPSVTVVARALQAAGLIKYSRGVITVVDRKGLEEAACECYGIIRRALHEM